jgi:hypothetical protein
VEFDPQSGETYPEPFAAKYASDMRALDQLAKAIKASVGLFAQIRVMVDPGGLTDKGAILRTENGGVVSGRDADVSVLSFADKLRDFSFLLQFHQELERRISRAFLRGQSVQRSGERVTAEEFRTLFQEMEQALGSPYTRAARGFQLPTVRWAISKLVEKQILPQAFSEFEVTITTGIDAIGRSATLQRLTTALGTAIQLLGPDITAQIIRPEAVVREIFTSAGLPGGQFVKTAEEIQQQQQQQQIMQAALPAAAAAAAEQTTQQ